MLTTREAAERLGVSRMTVRRLFHQGRLAGRQIGRPILITEQSVDALLQQSTTKEIRR